MTKKHDIVITVSGSAGVGKSAVASAITTFLKEIYDVEVRLDDPEACNMPADVFNSMCHFREMGKSVLINTKQTPRSSTSELIDQKIERELMMRDLRGSVAVEAEKEVNSIHFLKERSKHIAYNIEYKLYDDCSIVWTLVYEEDVPDIINELKADLAAQGMCFYPERLVLTERVL